MAPSLDANDHPQFIPSLCHHQSADDGECNHDDDGKALVVAVQRSVGVQLVANAVPEEAVNRCADREEVRAHQPRRLAYLESGEKIRGP